MTTVCITGASGFLATHVVRAFVEHGDTVHGTVRSLSNSTTLAPLREAVSEFSSTALQLFEADLTDPTSSGFARALRGCEVLVHTASPVVVDTRGLDDDAAMRAFTDPAVAGTIALLSAAHAAGVKHCVLTASTGCMLGRPEFDEPRTRSVLSAQVSSDIEWMTAHKQWYRLAKTQQELAARKFCTTHSMGISTLHPSLILGPYYGGPETRLSVGHELVLRWLTDASTIVPNGHTGVVDVREIAVSGLMLFLAPPASSSIPI
eukprot:COSAG02_NODE_578_length_20075_cov_93.607930_5_plen_262_part_00